MTGLEDVGVVDRRIDWPDYRPGEPRPYGEAPVWVGVTESEGQPIAIAVVAGPVKGSSAFRLLELKDLTSAGDPPVRLRPIMTSFNVAEISTGGAFPAISDRVRSLILRGQLSIDKGDPRLAKSVRAATAAPRRHPAVAAVVLALQAADLAAAKGQRNERLDDCAPSKLARIQASIAGTFGEPPLADPSKGARFLYWMGWTLTELALGFGTSLATVDGWKRAGRWDEAAPGEASDA